MGMIQIQKINVVKEIDDKYFSEWEKKGYKIIPEQETELKETEPKRTNKKILDD